MIPLPETIKIFPLSEVVLFPDTLMPLHIFEPRYQEMLSDALRGDRLIGMTLIRDGGPSGHPSVFSTGCAGKIVEHEALEDGRSLIVLQGTLKFRIREETASGKAYRTVRVQALHEAPPPIEKVRVWRDELCRAVKEFIEASGVDDETAETAVENLDSASAVNYLSAVIPFPPIEKQSLLECPTMETRYDRLLTLLQFRTTELRFGMDLTSTISN